MSNNAARYNKGCRTHKEEASMKTMIAKLGLLLISGLFAVSCATSPKEYQVELVDSADKVQKQETINTYEKFPYIDFRSSRL